MKRRVVALLECRGGPLLRWPGGRIDVDRIVDAPWRTCAALRGSCTLRTLAESIARERTLTVRPAPKLLERVRIALRVRHRSPKTERAYVGWIRRFIVFNAKRHPVEMGAAEVEGFLSTLAVEGNVSASTQNQALAAILFLYRDVLGISLPWMDGIVRAKRSERLPVVLGRQEVAALLAQLGGRERLMATLLYGSGLRLAECIRLRVKEIDFEKREILVRAGKGDKDRVTMLPEAALIGLGIVGFALRLSKHVASGRGTEIYTSGTGIHLSPIGVLVTFALLAVLAVVGVARVWLVSHKRVARGKPRKH